MTPDMQELHTTFAAKGLLVAQAVPFDDPDWNYKAYSAASDYLILMAYDQHWTGSDAGSVAAQDWFEQKLIARMRPDAVSGTPLYVCDCFHWQVTTAPVVPNIVTETSRTSSFTSLISG